MTSSDAARWCDGIARAVRGGATLHAAVASAERPAAIDSQLSGFTLALNRGQPLSAALAQHRALFEASPHLRLVAIVLATLATQGGPAAEPVDRAAATLRARAAAEADRAAQSAQARMSALVMTSLPIVMLILMLLTSPSVRTIVTSPLGAGVVVVGVGLNTVGWLWMRRIVDGAAR